MSNSDWLNKRTEMAIEPELEICDAHHHLWDYPSSRYLADEFISDLNSGHRFMMPLSGFGFHKHDLPPTSDDLTKVTRD